MKHIKLIIRDGIVENALAGTDCEPIEVEVIDVCKDYDDYEWLNDYADEVCADSRYKKIPYTVAHDSEEI